MNQALLNVHSYLAYAALILLVLASINAIVGLTSKKFFKDKDLRLSLFTLIVCHTQLLVGLIVYFVSEKGFQAFAIEGAMKNPELRLTMLEHPLVNIIAITLITIGWSRHKKAATNEAKFKSITVFYAIGFVLILSRIPWSLWF